MDPREFFWFPFRFQDGGLGRNRRKRFLTLCFTFKFYSRKRVKYKGRNFISTFKSITLIKRERTL